jgi:hypothetical protein
MDKAAVQESCGGHRHVQPTGFTTHTVCLSSLHAYTMRGYSMHVAPLSRGPSCCHTAPHQHGLVDAAPSCLCAIQASCFGMRALRSRQRSHVVCACTCLCSCWWRALKLATQVLTLQLCHVGSAVSTHMLCSSNLNAAGRLGPHWALVHALWHTQSPVVPCAAHASLRRRSKSRLCLSQHLRWGRVTVCWKDCCAPDALGCDVSVPGCVRCSALHAGCGLPGDETGQHGAE